MTSENLMIEVVLRKDASNREQYRDFSKFQGTIDAYLSTELDDKIILDFPLDWIGFKDGEINDLLKYFGETMYIALAYYAGKSEIVTDIDGAPIDSYDVVVNNKRVSKYVKKKLRIVNIIDQSKNMFELSAYVLDLRVTPPVVKVLEIYSGGFDGGLRLESFLGSKREAV